MNQANSNQLMFLLRVALQERWNAMQKFKTFVTSRLAVFIGVVVLALVVAFPLMGAAQDQSDKANGPDQHAQHKDNQPLANQNLASQVAELRAKVARLEAVLQQKHQDAANLPPQSSGAGGQAMGMKKDDMGEKSSMQPGQGKPAAAGMGGMSGGASLRGVDAGMTARLDKMIGMMDMMVRMMDTTVGMMDRMTGGTGGGAAAAGTPKAGGMMDDKMEMGGGAMKPGHATPPMGGMKDM